MKVQIQQIIRETPEAVTIVFEENPVVKDYKPGQFTNIAAEIDGEKVTRSFSFSSSPFIDKFAAITVKRNGDGKMSNYLSNRLKAGDYLEVSGPSGRFVASPDPESIKFRIMIAGGSGITPVYSIIRSVLRAESRSKILLLYANRDLSSMIFKVQLENLALKYPGRLQIIHFLSDPLSSDPSAGVTINDRIDEENLMHIYQRFIAPQKIPVEYYICGPESLTQMTVDFLIDQDINPDLIFTEHYQSKSKVATGDGPPNNDVARINTSGKGYDVVFNVPFSQSILLYALNNRINLPHSCKEAMCGACKARLIQGKVRMEKNYALPDEELEAGYVLLCSGYPESGEISLQYD